MPAWKRWSPILLRPEGLYGTRPDEGGNKAAKLKAIHEALRKVKPVWLATDCDREGQLIGQEILEHYQYRGQIMRVMFTGHIRGLGLKGMRVWDFGWQLATKGWGTGEEGEIRLLLHATDPDYLEQRLGRPASKGCVRIPAAMNRFLDHYSILDADYEQVAKDNRRFEALLLPDRTPTPLAGNALVVVDSSETSPPGA